MDLAEFLLARLAEDEAAATAAAGPHGASFQGRSFSLSFDKVIEDAYDMLGREIDEHITRWGPPRVLAEVEAKRVILNIHSAPPPPEDEERWGQGLWPNRCLGCGTIPPCDDPITEDRDNCPVLRALALPYPEHPDCHPSWLPAVKA